MCMLIHIFLAFCGWIMNVNWGFWMFFVWRLCYGRVRMEVCLCGGVMWGDGGLWVSLAYFSDRSSYCVPLGFLLVCLTYLNDMTFKKQFLSSVAHVLVKSKWLINLSDRVVLLGCIRWGSLEFFSLTDFKVIVHNLNIFSFLFHFWKLFVSFNADLYRSNRATDFSTFSLKFLLSQYKAICLSF